MERVETEKPEEKQDRPEKPQAELENLQDQAENRQGQAGQPSKAKPRSAIEKILAFFFKSEDPQKEKKRLLRDIAKRLKRMKQKLYEPGGEQALSGMGKLFFVYYKLFGPAQNLVKRAESSKALKDIVIEQGMTDAQRSLRENLEEMVIRERLKTTSVQELGESIKGELAELIAGFTAERTREIDLTYNQLAAFLDLVHYDYFFLLKKYDAKMAENDFAYEPRFEAINGEYLLDDLKEFHDVLLSIDETTDWQRIFRILKDYRNVDVISEKNWTKAFKKLMDLRRSRVFELIIMHLSTNPAYTPNPARYNEKIVEQYVAKLKTQTELVIRKIGNEKRDAKIEKLAHMLFASSKVLRMRNYTEKTNALFQRQMLRGFTQVTAINYVRAFLDDYFKTEIHDLVNLLLIKGKWVEPQASQPLSENLHRLFKLNDNIEEFDKSLSEEEDTGRRLRNLCYGAEKDKKLIPRVRKMLVAVNESAHAMVYQSCQSLITIGKILKRIHEDASKKPPELILNFREINSSVEGALKRLIVEVYKKIYCFIQLLQFYIDKEKVPSAVPPVTESVS